ncbi:MAG: 1-deoxy-D-xylulose-5-phosphate reductoisomerase [Clostridiales Family XIII bacterium]|nr:1-deoxy-D-xylulose-5-phosphate reductoisomerase [Clostridiales Family XIII bacterium]
MKRIAVFGSTGSIGTQALSIIAANPRRLEAVLLTCRSRIDMLREQIERFHPAIVAVERPEDAAELRREYPNLRVCCGRDGLNEAAQAEEYDVMLNAIVGIAGLEPTLTAIAFGGGRRDGNLTIALANKETLVTGGRFVMSAAANAGISIIPVDSEHSAIFQCLAGNKDNAIKRIMLTASGGPFRGYSLEQLKSVTVEDALIHPNWNMGRKITVDSATMVNKGLEIIEAKWLYGTETSRIEVLIHPQSIVHSLVEYEDGAIMAQMGFPSMIVPISYAFSHPERWTTDTRGVDLAALGALRFDAPTGETRRSLDMAYRVMRESEEYGRDSGAIALNGANEALVQLFLDGEIAFLDIIDTLEHVLERHDSRVVKGIDDIMDADRQARESALSLVRRQRRSVATPGASQDANRGH